MLRGSPPLRFLATVCLLWIGGRVGYEYRSVFITQPAAAEALPLREVTATVKNQMPAPMMVDVPATIDRTARTLLPRAFPVRRVSAIVASVDLSPLATPRLAHHRTSAVVASVALPALDDSASHADTRLAMVGPQSVPSPVPPPAVPTGTPYPSPIMPNPIPDPAPSSRWRGEAWALVRRGGIAKPISNGTPMLGGSQAGVRVHWKPQPNSALSLYGRASGVPGPMRINEIALGAAVTTRAGVPLTLAVERRQRTATDGRSAFAAYVATGLPPNSRMMGLGLDGYVQAGMVGLRRRDLFIQGDAEAYRSLWSEDGLDVRLGAMIGGAVQPGAGRLDVGPRVTARWSGPNRQIRATLDWRQRVAGRASPSSGSTLTIATDF